MKDDLRSFLSLLDLRDDRRTDGNRIGLGAIHAAHHSRSLFKIDERHIVRLLRWPRMDRADRIDRSTPGGFDPFELLSLGSCKSGREIGHAVAGITLQQEAAFAERGAPSGFGRCCGLIAHGMGILRAAWPVNHAVAR